MILKDETIAVLENYQKIDDSIGIFEGNILRVKNISNNGHGVENPESLFTSAEVPEYFTRDFGIEDLRDFLKIIKAFKGADIDLKDEESTHCTIRYSNSDIVIRYNYAPLDKVTCVKKDLKMPESEIKFTISEKDLNDLKKVSKLQKLEHFKISPVNGKDQVMIQACTIGPDYIGDSNTCEIYLDSEINNLPEFSVIIGFEFINKLMQGTYDVSVSSKRIAEFNCKHKLGRSDYKGIKYWIALNTESKFGEEEDQDDKKDKEDLDTVGEEEQECLEAVTQKDQKEIAQ